MAQLSDGCISHKARIICENARWYPSLREYRPVVTAPETQAEAGVDLGITPRAVVQGDNRDLVVEDPKGHYALEH